MTPAARRDAARPAATERVLFALVANRALAPSSKLAAAGWVTHDVHVPGLAETSDDACYRAMDWLLEVADRAGEARCSTQVANLLDLEVDLLFFDTTTTYFETEDPDEPVSRDAHGRPLPDRQPHRRRHGTDDGGRGSRRHGAARRTGSGSGPTASPRTPATTCPRS